MSRYKRNINFHKAAQSIKFDESKMYFGTLYSPHTHFYLISLTSTLC